MAELNGSVIKVLQVERHNKTLGVGGYSLFAALCTSKSDCTEIHPYVVFVLVSFFVINVQSGVAVEKKKLH